MQAAASDLISQDSALSRGQVPAETYIDDELALEEPQTPPSDDKALPASTSSAKQLQQSDFPPSRPSLHKQSTQFLRGDGPYRGFELSTRRSMVELRDEPGDSQYHKSEKRKAFWRRQLVNLLLIASWYFFSTLISLYNKWFFSPQHYGFSYPLFVTTFHMIVQFCLSGIVLSFVPSFRPKVNPTPQEYLKKASPCGVATSLDIGLSNLSLKTVTLSFYTMCKSSSLGFVLLFAFLFRLERPTWKLCGIISVITVGVILMVSGETQYSFIGMVEVLAASAMGGLRWALTQKLLDKEAMGLNNPFATLYWLAPIMAITLAICSMILEGPMAVFSQDRFWDGMWNSLRTGALICFPGCLAFAMTTSEFALIQRTSVVTLSVAGIFKEVSTIFLGTLIFHDELTPINISGLCVAIFGIALYNYLKYRQSIGKHSSRTHDFAPVPDTEQGIYSQPQANRSQMDNLPFYNPADEGLEAPAASETQYQLGSDSDDDGSSTELGEDEADDRRGFHREHKPVEERQIAGLKAALKSDAQLVQLHEEERILENELQPDRK